MPLWMSHHWYSLILSKYIITNIALWGEKSNVTDQCGNGNLLVKKRFFILAHIGSQLKTCEQRRDYRQIRLRESLITQYSLCQMMSEIILKMCIHFITWWLELEMRAFIDLLKIFFFACVHSLSKDDVSLPFQHRGKIPSKF